MKMHRCISITHLHKCPWNWIVARSVYKNWQKWDKEEVKMKWNENIKCRSTSSVEIHRNSCWLCVWWEEKNRCCEHLLKILCYTSWKSHLQFVARYLTYIFIFQRHCSGLLLWVCVYFQRSAHFSSLCC